MHPGIKYLAIILILGTAIAFGCVKGNVDQLQEAKETAQAGASKAVSGDVIKTAEEAGKTGEEPGEEEGAGEEKETPEEGGGEEGGEEPGGGLLPGQPPELPPVQPLKSPVTMDDLTYPIFNPATGKSEKPKTGGVTSFTMSTPDSFYIVVGYYDQIVKGLDYEEKNNIGEGGRMYAQYKVNDSGNTFTVLINDGGQGAATTISLIQG